MTSEHILIVDADERFARDTASIVQGMGLHASVAVSVDHAWSLAEHRHPTLLVSEIDVAGQLAGIPLADAIQKRWGASVIFMTTRANLELAAAIAPFDSCGVLCKPFHRIQLEMSLRLAIGRRAIALERKADNPDPLVSAMSGDMESALREIAAIVRRLGLVKEMPGPSWSPTLLSRLRPREQEIVALLLQHQRVPAVARLLGISANTVRNHLKRVFKSLGVHSQQELLAYLQRPNPDRPSGMPDRSSTSRT